MNEVIEPSVLAVIQAQQDYQQKLDAYHYAEEKRLRQKSNYGKQALLGFIVVLGMITLCVWMDLPSYLIYLKLFAIGGTVFLSVMEAMLIIAYLACLRPNPQPIPAKK